MIKYFCLFLLVVSLSGCGLSASKTSPINQNNVQPEGSVAQEKIFSIEEVRSANSVEKCWTTINNNVYDLTGYINKHKGGPDKILSICGKDGRPAFESQHNGEKKPEMDLDKLLIGKLR